MSDLIGEIQTASKRIKCPSNHYTDMLRKSCTQYVEGLEGEGIFEVSQQIDVVRVLIQAKSPAERLMLSFIESYIHHIADEKRANEASKFGNEASRFKTFVDYGVSKEVSMCQS